MKVVQYMTETQLADLLGMTVGAAEQKMNEIIMEWIASDSNLQTFLEAMGLFPLQSTPSIMVTGICIGWAEAQRQAAENSASYPVGEPGTTFWRFQKWQSSFVDENDG